MYAAHVKAGLQDKTPSLQQVDAIAWNHVAV